MKRIVIALVLSASLGAGLRPAIATHDDPCSGSVVTTVETATDTYYLDNRGADNGLWTYREMNDIPGLQRGGESLLLEHMVEDPCNDDLTEYGVEAVPDELII